MSRSNALIALIVGISMFAMGSASAVAGDAAKGKKVFNKCKACHTVKKGKNRIGPSLFGVIGRQCGSVPKARHSSVYKAACAKAPFAWDEKNLDTYLTDGSKFLSGIAGVKKRSTMTLKLKKAKDRANVIAYLKSIK
ncbi:MAG: c-type cytochrome [Alphaproteobacteria bacterium]|nr:c-type cytochrome [Alphaproteobacteria bacterium]